MSPPRSTRNSRECRARTSRPASNVDDSPSKPLRSCAAKRMSYREETDSEEDEENTILRKRRKLPGSGSELDSNSSVSTPPSLDSSESCDDFVKLDSSPAMLFKSFPLEIHENILRFVESDRDVARYGRLCKQAKNAVDALVWSVRYGEIFDVTAEHEVVEDVAGNKMISRYWYQIAADEYKARQVSFNDGWLTFNRNRLVFEPDHFGRQLLWIKQDSFLRHLKNLVFESDARRISKNGRTKITGKNFNFIRKMTSEGGGANYVDVLDTLLEKDFTSTPRGESQTRKANTLIMTQLCLLPMILDPAYNNGAVFHWNASQQLAYATHASVPLFRGFYKTQVNTHLLVNILNFFKFHLKVGNGEGILNEAYSQLEADQLPQMWPGKIPIGTQTLEGHWKGSTTYLSSKDLKTLRLNYDSQDSYQDAVDDEDNCFMDMTFFADEDKFSAENWPKAWDSWIVSDPYSMPNPKTKAFPKSRPLLKHFWGTSRGTKTGHMFGRLHAINNQGDFHGWQRVSFIKCFENAQGAFNDSDIWVYEGVVLPGGRVIIGRWMHPNAEPLNPDAHESGPFLIWNVDRSSAERAITPDEAWAFSATIDDPLFQSLPLPEMHSTNA